MREIKFRAKTQYGNAWVYGDLNQTDLLSEDEEYRIAFDTPNGATARTSVTVIQSTIGQFTGLKDKNGKEIYEGDVANFWGGIGIIKWIGYGFNISWGREYFGLDSPIEIIGNIHDNPELLNKK